MDQRDEVLNRFRGQLSGGLTATGESCFHWIYDHTIEPALNAGSNYQDAERYLNVCVTRIAHCAQKAAGGKAVNWNDLARAGNCVIPAFRDLCNADLIAEPDRVPRGEFCKILPGLIPLEPPVE